MPGPLVAAAAGGIGSAIIGARGASRAADAQKDAAKDQIKAAKDTMAAQNIVNEQMYNAQRGTIAGATRANQGYAQDAYNTTNALSGRLREQQAHLAGVTRDANGRLYRNALDDGTGRLRTDRNNNVRDIRGTADRLTERVNDARDASLGYFEPAIGMGNNALAAYSHNLGLGKAPKGYTGLELTPGAQFAMDEARTGLEGGAAARGGLYSGAAMEELQRKSQGIASQDRDAQMAQMFALGGLGQNAAGQAANIRSGATDRIIDIRGGEQAAVQGARNTATQGMNALQGAYTPMMASVNDQFMASMDAIRNRDTLTRGNAADNYAGRRIDISNTQMGQLGTARANRANLQGAAMGQYGNALSGAYNAMGQAGAAQAVGGTNAIMGGLQNGASMYGLLGGQLPGQGVANTYAGNSGFTNPFANFTNPFARAPVLPTPSATGWLR